MKAFKRGDGVYKEGMVAETLEVGKVSQDKLGALAYCLSTSWFYSRIRSIMGVEAHLFILLLEYSKTSFIS
ncbi:hypothetical protein [Bartonella jaculi]|uniref:hypothetical protein n=1 Tax=Bartonella jaculi TaxID=686226 RepID=UPI0031ED7175